MTSIITGIQEYFKKKEAEELKKKEDIIKEKQMADTCKDILFRYGNRKRLKSIEDLWEVIHENDLTK